MGRRDARAVGTESASRAQGCTLAFKFLFLLDKSFFPSFLSLLGGGWGRGQGWEEEQEQEQEQENGCGHEWEKGEARKETIFAGSTAARAATAFQPTAHTHTHTLPHSTGQPGVWPHKLNIFFDNDNDWMMRCTAAVCVCVWEGNLE